MIDVRELRIGNFVSIYKPMIQNAIPHKVKSLFFDDADNCFKIELDKYKPVITEVALKPISLTEELLLKCGFENDTIVDRELVFVLKMPKYEDEDYLQELAISAFGCEITKYGVELNVVPCSNETGLPVYSELERQATSRRITSLHQLQNLYFDLTGQELEVNL